MPNHPMKTKIIIAGIGGVGGYFGGLLAKCFEEDEDVSVCFLARGAHLEVMRTNGLRVIKGSDEFVARPAVVSDKAEELGVGEVIVICTKSYDLEATIAQLKPCINEHTIILPLLNGVDSTERIKAMLPNTIVLQGCAYIVSRLINFPFTHCNRYLIFRPEHWQVARRSEQGRNDYRLDP